MNILLVTGHPAQVHNFRNLKFDLEEKGHKVFWMATNKDISKYLLDYYGIKYHLLRRPKKSVLSKFFVLLQNTIISIKFIRKNNIDIAFSRISPNISIACFFLRRTHFGLTDTETAIVYDKFFSYFLTVLFTGKSFKRQLRSDQIRFDGNIELFYLHPNRFEPLEKSKVAELLGIATNERYVIMRFVSWDAYHDKGLSGFTNANKIRAVEEISKFSKIFISSEKELPVELESYRVQIPPEKMHDVLTHATLFFGESATMASESAIMGTPAIFLNENWFGSTDEEKEFNLLFSFKQKLSEQEKAIQKGVELIKMPDLKKTMQKKREIFLENKIDPTAFFVWFIENYPESKRIMKENPDYQYKFK